MKISLINAGKRFNRDWVFRNLNYVFTAGNSYAITGPNGSGKSTLLQVIGGAMMQTEGKVEYEVAGFKAQKIRPKDKEKSEKKRRPDREIPVPKNNMQSTTENFYQYISLSAPYLEVIEEMTVKEFLAFHQHFKPLLPGMDIPEIIATVGLEKAANKQLRYYSSGMKQRVRLAQAIFSNVPCVLLDEPCTNLDTDGIALYHQLVTEYCADRLVIVSSNEEQEYKFCTERIHITDWKK